MNKNKEFKSVFKDEFKMFVDYKKSCGYKYNEKITYKYFRLDNYFYKIDLKEKTINQNILDGWYQEFQDCKISNKAQNCYSVIKSFTNFLIQNNYKKITIPEVTIKSTSFIPHIYSEEEIKSIFKFCKNKKINCSKNKNYDAYYVILCILYGCGLRISEVINLKIENIDLKNKTLTVIKSKNNVTRIVPMTASVFNELIEYINKNERNNLKEKIFLNHFSNNTRGKYINEYNFRTYFNHIVLKNLNIYTYEGKKPRVHDLRHTFAINSLIQMEKKGFDIYTSLSILSVYLGHKSIVETEKYLRLIPNEFEKIINQVNNYTSNIYKEKKFYE